VNIICRALRTVAWKNCYGYKVVKEKLNDEVVSFDAYYLTDDQGKRLSFWNDIPLNLRGDEATACI
jgi:hypothetical protein